MTDDSGPRIAVLGASGIGKFHADWWTKNGATVCAIAGSTQDSAEKTSALLGERIGFKGRTYTSLTKLLEKEDPDIVDVCLPHRLHYEASKQALEAGCGVLCEKPLVYDRDLPRTQLLEQAQELVLLAKNRGVRLGVCTQYVVGARIFQNLWNGSHPGERIERCDIRLAAPAKGRAPDPRRIWIDLGPHPLSVIQTIAPGAQVQWNTLETDFDGYRALAAFDVEHADNSILSCTIETRNTVEEPSHERSFAFNGYPFVVHGHTDESGDFRARIATSDGDHIVPDMMYTLIGEFLAGAPPADGCYGIDNLELLLRMLPAEGS